MRSDIFGQLGRRVWIETPSTGFMSDDLRNKAIGVVSQFLENPFQQYRFCKDDNWNVHGQLYSFSTDE